MKAPALHDAFNALALYREGPEAEIYAVLLMHGHFVDQVTCRAETELVDDTCIASCVIQREGACQRGIAAWVRPHVVTRTDWDQPARAVFVGEAEQVKPVTESELLRLVRVRSLTRGV